MTAKTILVLEDRPQLRDNLCGMFADRGFRVLGAADVDEARAHVGVIGNGIDVLLLDMHLPGGGITGAEFGIEVKDTLSEWPPEFLIYSAYEQSEYYQLALKLGAATYFRKPTPYDELVRHVRALTLRRALQIGKPGLQATVERIARASRNRLDALERFCSEVVSMELETAIQRDCLLLLTDSAGTTMRCGGPDYLPARSDVFDRIQMAAHGQVVPTEPFTVDLKYVRGTRPLTDPTDPFVSLEGAAFIPIGDGSDFRLSLGILRESKIALEVSEQPAALARVLGAYFRPAIMNHLLNMTETLTDLASERRTLLRATAQFCLYIGQEVIATLDEDGSQVALEVPTNAVQKLRLLGEELWDAGELLGRLDDTIVLEQPAQPSVSLDMDVVVRNAWHELNDLGQVQGSMSFRIDGNCEVRGDHAQLHIAVLRVLQWFLGRAASVSNDLAPQVSVACRATASHSEVQFDDNSARLARSLREKLFAPFGASLLEPPAERFERGRRLGLYLAKALVESAGGLLTDCSESLNTPVGHRLVMRFPSSH